VAIYQKLSELLPYKTSILDLMTQRPKTKVQRPHQLQFFNFGESLCYLQLARLKLKLEATYISEVINGHGFERAQFFNCPRKTAKRKINDAPLQNRLGLIFTANFALLCAEAQSASFIKFS